MPRKRKTQSGAPAQSVPDSVPGVRYGEGVEHQQLAQTLPPADARAASPTAGAPAPAPAPAMPMSPGDVMAGLQDAPLGMLTSTQRPKEPITAGLATGPGPGPSALRKGTTPLARTLANLAERTGNEQYAILARKAGLR